MNARGMVNFDRPAALHREPPGLGPIVRANQNVELIRRTSDLREIATIVAFVLLLRRERTGFACEVAGAGGRVCVDAGTGECDVGHDFVFPRPIIAGA